MDERIARLIKLWQKRNILGFYTEDKEGAIDLILEMIPQEASIGISGSVTLDQLGIVKILEERGNKVFNQYKAGINKEEALALRKKGVDADFYLASANAISEKGQLVFFSAYGTRIAGISYAKRLIVVCGINKITSNLKEAIKRAREYATPLNCKRLNWNSACVKEGRCRERICVFPNYKRMCCQILIVEAEMEPERIKVILVGEKLGF
ncbi:MAG: lactate utilization protein [Candidatus Omnitrophica bacterium]|nr:lactate utilization protein [Candidatus Omnitrophota bacterium]